MKTKQSTISSGNARDRRRTRRWVEFQRQSVTGRPRFGVRIPLYFGWELLVGANRVPDSRRHIVGPFKTYRAFGVTVAVLLVVIVGAGLLFVNRDVRAATYTWTQTAWNTLTGNTAVHPTNQTNWTEYSAKDSTVSTGTSVSLAPTGTTIAHTSDTDFNAGTKSSTIVSGSGSAGYVSLSSTEGGTPSYLQYTVNGNDYEYDATNQAVWVVSGSTITKYLADGSSTTAVATINLNPTYDTGGAVYLVFDPTNNVLWALGRTTSNNGLVLTKINAATAGIITSYTLATDANTPRDVRYDSALNVVWVAYSWTSGNRILKVDPSNGSVTLTITPSSVVNEMAIDNDLGVIWYVDGTSTVYKQPKDGSASTSVSLTGSYTASKHIIYESATPAVWVTSENFSLYGYHKILTSNNSVTSKNDISMPTALAYDSVHDAIWIGSQNSSNMFKVSRSAMTISNTYALSAANASARIAYDPNTRALWFNNGGTQKTKRMTFVAYSSSGTFTSPAIDTNGNLGYTTLSYTAGTPTNTTLTVKVRTDAAADMSGATNWTFCGTLTSGEPITSGNWNCVNAGQRYVQYQLALSTTNTAVSPTLSDITIGYLTRTSGTITSSPFDSVDASNVLAKLAFSAASSGTVETEVVTDDFERADLGNNWYDHHYGPASGSPYSHICNSSDFCGSGNGFAFNVANYTAQDFTRDQFSEIVVSLAAANQEIGAVVRKTYGSGSVNYYDAVTDGATFFQLKKVFLDSPSTLIDLGAPYPTVGDTIRLEAIGTTLNVYLNGSLRGSTTDTSQSSGTPGVYAYGGSGVETGQAESWRGGDLTTVGGTLQFQLRTSANGSSWTSWMGPTGTGDYFTDPAGNQTMNSAFTDGVNDRYVQYKAFLSNTDNTSTPILQDVTTTYVVNAPPEFESTATAVQNSDGTVTIQYSVRSPDTSTDTGSVGLITPSFEYSLDNGSHWSDITTGLPAGATDPKAVDATNYTTYSTTWNAKAQLDGTYAAQAKIRVTVSDLQAANATAQSATTAFIFDVKDPTLGGTPISVNATTTPATVTLSASDDTTLQMCVTLDNTQTNCTAYNGTTTMTLATDPDTVYVVFVDSKGNTASASAVTPQTPSNLIIRDLSNVPTDEYQLFVTWAATSVPVGQFANYKIYHSTDGTNYSLLSTITDKTINYYFHKSLTAGTTHYYKVATSTNTSNTSYYSAIISGIANGQGGGNDVVAPMISNVQATSITTQSAIITWDTDELANSTVGYSGTAAVFTTEVGVATMVDSAAGVGHHSVTLNNLTPGTTYHYRVQSSDPSDNTTTDTNGGDGYSFATIDGPTITNVTTTSVDNTSATVSWTTNVVADSTVRYSTSAALASPTTVTKSESVTQHVVTLTGLTAGTKYYYEVASDVALDPNGGNYFTFTTTNDTEPPAISSISVAPITDTQAVVTWVTNEKATGQVSYGTSTGVYPSQSAAVTTLNLNHAITLSGLSPNTDYHFQITSADSADNTATSTDQTFTTLDRLLTTAEAEALVNSLSDTTAPTISSIAIQDITANSANVTWTTNEDANSFVKFGPSGGDQVIYGNWVYGTTHTIPLLTLVPNTAYTYTVVSADLRGNLATATTATFSTTPLSAATLEQQLQNQVQDITKSAQDLPGPTIGGQPQVDASSTSATITWTTDKPATSLISFSSAAEYGTRKVYTQTVGDPTTYVTSHSVRLGNLAPDTDYHYQISSSTELFQTSTTTDATFHTPKQTFAIDNYSIDTPTTTKAVFRWTTNDTASGNIQVTPYRNNILSVDEQLSGVDETKSFIHQISLDALEPGVKYQVELISVNTTGQRTSRVIPTFSTASTGQPPVITQIRIDSALSPGEKVKVQTIVSWTTDVPSTSQVHYRSGVGRADDALPESTAYDTNYTKHHVVVITSFEPGAVYQLRVESKDSNGQVATSKALTTLTPQQQQTVFQVITNTFQQVFGWTQLFNR